MQMKALTFSSFGSPDVLEYIEMPIPELGPKDVLVKMKAIGLNYADIYRRKGLYHLEGSLPYIAGYEGSGVIVQTNSPKYNIGENISFADVPFANAEYVVVPESHVIPLPDNISCTLAASVLLQGLTALYLTSDSHNVHPNETILIYAASGGVGQLLTQICKHKGARVIGLTRNEDKLNIILQNKADYAFTLKEDWKGNVKKITSQKGVDVVYDSVGSTLPDSFELTKIGGQVVFYGMSGGDPKPVDPRMLMDTSKTLTGGDLWSYLTSEDERKKKAKQLFDLIEQGRLKITPAVQFKLSEGRKAHAYLENGQAPVK